MERVKVILLPGMSKENKSWIRDMALLLRPLASSISVHHYDHWYENRTFNFNDELERLIQTIGKEKEYVLIGKSAGAALALKAIKDKRASPCASILMGLPVNWARERHLPLESWLHGGSVPTLFIQNEKDPAFSYALLDALVKKSKRMHSATHALPGTTHDYKTTEVVPLIEAFIKDSAHLKK